MSVMPTTARLISPGRCGSRSSNAGWLYLEGRAAFTGLRGLTGAFLVESFADVGDGRLAGMLPPYWLAYVLLRSYERNSDSELAVASPRVN